MTFPRERQDDMQDTPQLVGASRSMVALHHQIGIAAKSDAKILITGESGVGKEIVARLIHASSARRSHALVAVNCAGVPESLLESELFGHVRGSFTDAYRDRPGLVDRAHRGTLFMDEVSEMGLRMQGLLLRFLETGEIQPVGGERLLQRVDVRVVAASNRDLREQLQRKTFREDLYYRLNVIHLVVPPLRDRRDDISVLLEHFLAVFEQQYRVSRPRFSDDTLKRLVRYDWPGNVRELRNLVERLTVSTPGKLLGVMDLPMEIRQEPVAASALDAPARQVADGVFDQMVDDGQSFWAVVYAPFMARDLTRDDLRQIVVRGLERTSGSYKMLVQLFNMGPNDYKRVLNFLRKHECHMPFQNFRNPPLKAAGPRQSGSSRPTAA